MITTNRKGETMEKVISIENQRSIREEVDHEFTIEKLSMSDILKQDDIHEELLFEEHMKLNNSN